MQTKSLRKLLREEEIEYGIQIGREEGIERGIEKGMERGIERGRQEEREKGRLEMARKMRQEGVSINIIEKTTNLSPKEIKKL